MNEVQAPNKQKLIAVLEKYGIVWQAFNSLEAAVDHALYALIYRQREADTHAAYEFTQERLQVEADRTAAR